MTVREEIQDLVLRAARRVLETTRGELSPAEAQRLCTNIEERIPVYTGRYPILGLLDQFDAAADAGHAGTVATNSAITEQRGEPHLGWDESLGRFTTPVSDQWRQAIQESAAEATENHFNTATALFEKGQRAQATEHLCSGIVCSIAATAALMGWPHRDRDDDLKVVVGLATGSLPAEGESIYKLLKTASREGQDLNSAFAAAMGQPTDVRSGAYDEAGRTQDEAMLFAKTVVDLADQLGRKLL